MTTFLDTNVLVYLLTKESQFHKWSVSQLEECKKRGPALISDIVYCEFSVAMPTQEATDAAVAQFALERVRGTKEALFLAGKAFQTYRRNGGPKTRMLPDFIVGAIAADAGAPLITVNAADFGSYFPGVTIISP